MQLKLRKQRAVHRRRERGAIMGFLQRRGAAHDRVGLIDRDFADALDTRARRVVFAGPGAAQPVVQSRCDVDAGQRILQYGLAAVVIEARHAEQIAEHAQYLPRRPRFRERQHHATHGLHPAFGADKRAGGLRKW